ncbi:hypothetical protein C8Q70DRAFT_930375 [Cubamyces menziesii]|nr:hypothetical protein C8Q70DRAFT_930375 [Cubamyces menziesii]
MRAQWIPAFHLSRWTSFARPRPPTPHETFRGRLGLPRLISWDYCWSWIPMLLGRQVTSASKAGTTAVYVDVYRSIPGRAHHCLIRVLASSSLQVQHFGGPRHHVLGDLLEVALFRLFAIRYSTTRVMHPVIQMRRRLTDGLRTGTSQVKQSWFVGAPARARNGF